VRSQVKGQKAKAKWQICGRPKVARREVALAVLLVQVPERGLERRLLVGLLRELERALLQGLLQ
jgi:hypothetical protein